MITPSPTTEIDPALARGVLLGVLAQTATKPAMLVFGVPNTSYELHLRPGGEVPPAVGKRLIGVIRVEARRVDRVDTGGRFVEPVAGRPRRVQGRVVRMDGEALVVDAGVPIHLLLCDARQGPADFEPGAIVSCDVLDGATFTPRTA
ncbi:MAG: hypothetical protein SFY69_09555 [Planctomycetota bacterium]|nr:hypothetical protein [Planctomycetota bacterium]